MTHPSVYVRQGPHGRGVFAVTPILQGTMICIDPVILIEIDALRDGSEFNQYPMHWTDTHNAIALGLSNLLNHSETPNCVANAFPKRNEMEVITIKRVEKDEELRITYKCPVWF